MWVSVCICAACPCLHLPACLWKKREGCRRTSPSFPVCAWTPAVTVLQVCQTRLQRYSCTCVCREKLVNRALCIAVLIEALQVCMHMV